MKRARVVALLVVAGTVGIATAAAVGDHMTVVQKQGVRIGPGTALFNAYNDGSNTLSVFGIGRDTSCSMYDPVPQITAAFENHMAPFSMPVSSVPEPIEVICPSTGPSATMLGIRRCKFDVQLQGGEAGPGETIASFSQACLYRTSPGIVPSSSGIWNVGDVMVGGGDMKTFTITAGAAFDDVYYSIIDQEDAFTVVSPCSGVHCIDGADMNLNEPRNVEIACSPKSLGAKTALLHIVSNSGRYTEVTLQCNGTDDTPVGPDIDIMPTTTLSQTSPRGTPVSDQLTLMNLGTSDLVINNMIVGGSSTDWTFTGMSPPCGFPCTIAASGSVTMNFSFTPSIVGPISPITFTLSTNDPDETMVTITATGTGTGSTLTLVAPTDATVDIGTAAIMGEVSRAFTFENAPATDGIMTNASIQNESAAWFDLSPTFANMNPDVPQDFTVTCTPLAAGTETATLVVSSTATEGSTYSIPITCTGTSGNLTVSPSAIDLGDIEPGTTPITRTISLMTNGPTLAVGAITETPDRAQITLGAPSNTEVVSGTPTTFVLTYVPGNADGEVTTTIDVTAGGDTRQVTFRANVVRKPMCITPGGIAQGPIDFGAIAIHQSSATEEIVLQNCGTTMLTLSSPTIEPAGEFRLTNELPMSLAPGATATATVAFSPQLVGVRMAQLIVPTSNGDLAVDLMGTGLGDGNNLGSPASLYACDCASSNPPSAIVILLALVVPLIPRRRRRC